MSSLPAGHASQFDSGEQQDRAVQLGMWVFLATEMLFFGPLFLGYIYGRTHFGGAFASASRHTHLVLGTVNTGVLLTSSLTMALAAQAGKDRSGRLAAVFLWTTAILGVIFLVFKGFEYRLEWKEHLFPAAGFSFAAPYFDGARFFYVLYFAATALHALHLTIGVVMVSVFAMALAGGHRQFASSPRIEIVGLYWHFVDLVWIFLYPILYLVGRSA